MNASSEGSTIADSKGGLKNGRSISKVSEKKIVRKYSLPPFKRIVFCQLKDLNPCLMV